MTFRQPVIMDVTLRPFTYGDIGAWQRWKISIDLDKFMSRSAPSHFDGTVDRWSSEYRWFVIVVGASDVGAIWLERESGERGVVRLGMFLGDETFLGKGIGRRAIEQAIRQAQAALEFTRVRLAVRLNNERAIACYRACGFREVGRGTREDTRHGAIDFMTMEKEACPDYRVEVRLDVLEEVDGPMLKHGLSAMRLKTSIPTRRPGRRPPAR